MADWHQCSRSSHLQTSFLSASRLGSSADFPPDIGPHLIRSQNVLVGDLSEEASRVSSLTAQPSALDWHGAATRGRPGVILSRQGTMVARSGLEDGPFWVIDTAYYCSSGQEDVDSRFSGLLDSSRVKHYVESLKLRIATSDSKRDTFRDSFFRSLQPHVQAGDRAKL